MPTIADVLKAAIARIARKDKDKALKFIKQIQKVLDTARVALEEGDEVDEG